MKAITSLKIAAGYVCLSLVLVGAIVYIYRHTQVVAEVSATERLIRQHRAATERLVAFLLEAEGRSQAAGLGQADAIVAYGPAVDSVLQAAATLRRLTPDSTQRARLDTLTALVVAKQRRTLALARLMNHDAAGRVYQQAVADFQAGRRELKAHSQEAHTVVHERETTTVVRTRSGFFNRLADAFRRPRNDTVESRGARQTVATDTVGRDIDVSAPVADVLADVQREAGRQAAGQRGRVETQTTRLRRIGAALTRRTGVLLAHFEREEQRWMQRALEGETRRRRHAAFAVGSVAAVALVLVFVLLCQVWRDLRRSARQQRQLTQTNAELGRTNAQLEQTNSELDRARTQAEALLTQREQLMLTVTHDIKAPVSAIQGYLELLPPAADRQTADYLAQVRQSAHHLLALVGTLLDYHRLEAGKMDVAREPFDPGQTLTEAAEALRPVAARKGLQWGVAVAPSAHSRCLGDAFRLRQVADNLLTNALKFTKRGGVSLRTQMEAGVLEFAVTDTGCGMTEAEQQRIFDAFARLKSAQGQEGVGLGLAITQRLVALMGGRLTVSSQPGRGSTFCVRLPLPAATEAASGPAPTAQVAPLGPLRVLLVDDDRVQLRLTAEMLGRLSDGQVQVAAFWQPADAFGRLEAERFDLLLTDIQMPAMGGFDFLRRLRALPPPAGLLPVIAVTARSDMAESDLRQAGFAAALHKPFNLQELRSAVGRALGDTAPSAAALPAPMAEPAPAAEARSAATAGADLFAPLTAFAEGDAAAEHEILSTFADESTTHLAGLSAAIEAADAPEVGRLAHKMLPVFTLLQLPEAQALQELEALRTATALTPADVALARRVVARLEDLLAALRAALAAPTGAAQSSAAEAPSSAAETPTSLSTSPKS